MPYPITYRRPSYHSSSDVSITVAEKQRSIDESVRSGSSGMSHGIPDALSFDKIIAGGVCPPCTVRDFMNYLKYIEHDAENLQFFLWHADYAERFNALPDSEKSLAPEWTVAQAEAEAAIQAAGAKRPTKVRPEVAAVLEGTDFAPAHKQNQADTANPFYTPPRTPSEEKDRSARMSSTTDSTGHNSRRTDYNAKAEAAYEEAGLKWQPFTVQPYREEITRIISIYIAENAPRQLNLSASERNVLLHALENTTNPTAFREVMMTIEWTLRCQSHPNFIRWTICNGNRPRVVFARGLGVGGIVGGLIAAILITISSADRGWRVLSFIGFFIGIATLIAAWKGMCVVLHGMHHRHLRPWELFTEEDTTEITFEKHSFESTSTNSYEDEPWVAKYEKRNVIRKVFDREVWIQEPALRQIQDTIFIQAILGAFVISAVAVGIFCAFPKGGFY